ncbi:MAG: hypothetical protein NVSMB68_09580 [Thermoanaerobaculia bacterium]
MVIVERPVVLMMTAFSVRELPDLGHRVQAVIQKPFDVFELVGLVRDCVESRRLHDARSGMGNGAGVDFDDSVDGSLPISNGSDEN